MYSEFIELSKKSLDNLDDDEYKALVELSKDRSIVITKADKGNAVVIQNLADYRTKISEILNKDNKFRKLNSDETMKRETRLQTNIQFILI